MRGKSFVIWLNILFIWGCTAGRPPHKPPVPPPKNMEIIVLNDLCSTYQANWEWDSLGQMVSINLLSKKIKIMVDSTNVLIDGQRIVLNEPVRMVQSQVILPKDFEQKIFVPIRNLAEEPKVEFGKIRTIIVDAGHGGHDQGTKSASGLKEKDLVLDIVKRLDNILKSYGIRTYLTRANDTFITLQRRTEIASRHPDADLFLSIHANSAPDRSVKGIEVFSLKNLEAKEQGETQRKSNQRKLFSQYKMKTGDQNVKSIVADMLYESKQSDSERIADKIGEELSQSLSVRNRGTKEARFFVLRNTLIPAVLVEIGFLSNKEEAQLLKNPYYRQKIAVAVARAIKNYER